MHEWLQAALLGAAASLVFPHGALAQSPAGAPFRVWAERPGDQYNSNVVVRPDGGMVVVWDESAPGGGDEGSSHLMLRGFSVEDESLGEPFSVERISGSRCCFGGVMAGNEAGNLVVAYTYWQLAARRYGFADGPQALRLETSEGRFVRAVRSAAIDARGGFVVVWESIFQEPEDDQGANYGIFGRLIDSHGNPRGPEFHVNTVRQGHQLSPGVSMSVQTGSFVVVWNSNPTGFDAHVAGQLFGPDGTRIGREFRVSSAIPGDWQTHAQVAMAPDGAFVVVWKEPDTENSGAYVILGQRFTAAGQPLGPQLRVSKGVVGEEQFPQITMDARGNFVVTWNDDGVRGITLARLYRATGVPVGAPVPLTQGVGNKNAMVDFGGNGTFAIAWTELFSLTGIHAHARRFSASPGDEPCLFRQGVLACDTGRTGGVAEVRHRFGGPGDVGLLGDIDGDGRADPCVFRGGRFLCDTAHDYGTAELKERFGRSGDTPLLGDIDGNGRADACVYREGHFLCDSAHDGAVHEDIRLGEPGDVPLLGDVNGDDRSDPCLFRAGRFLCDVNHDATLDLEIRFGRAGDIPLLMDFDADGTVEPCLYRAGELLCDTGHDGGAAESTLTLGGGNGVPLAGNLDGL